MMQFTELPTSALEHVTEFLPFEDMWSIARTGSSALRSIATHYVTEATKDMGDPGVFDAWQLWKIRERAALARAISQRIWLDVDNYYLIFVGRRTDQDQPAGAYLMGSDFGKVLDDAAMTVIQDLWTSEKDVQTSLTPERISKTLVPGTVEDTTDLDDAEPIVGVCGSMMIDALGRVHLTSHLDSEILVDVSGVSDVVAFGSHREHVAVVTKRGELMTCGSSYCCRLGYVIPENEYRLKRVDALQDVFITQVASGEYHSLALDADGKVYAWGASGKGGLGCHKLDLILYDDWTVVRKDVDVVDVDSDDEHEYDHEDMYLGLLGPKCIGMECKIASIAAADEYSMMITYDGRLFACGDNIYGQLGTGDILNRFTPTRIDIGSGVRACHVSCGGRHTCLLTASVDGFAVHTAGSNTCSQLGYEGENKTVFTRVEALEALDIVCVCAGHCSSAAVTRDGEIYVWGLIQKRESMPRLLENCVVQI